MQGCKKLSVVEIWWFKLHLNCTIFPVWCGFWGLGTSVHIIAKSLVPMAPLTACRAVILCDHNFIGICPLVNCVTQSPQIFRHKKEKSWMISKCYLGWLNRTVWTWFKAQFLRLFAVWMFSNEPWLHIWLWCKSHVDCCLTFKGLLTLLKAKWNQLELICWF